MTESQVNALILLDPNATIKDYLACNRANMLIVDAAKVMEEVMEEHKQTREKARIAYIRKIKRLHKKSA